MFFITSTLPMYINIWAKNTQAIHKALLGILSSQKFLQEILFHSQAQISDLLSSARGKAKILSRCSDMNSGNPCHTSSSTEQFKDLHCSSKSRSCYQQIHHSTSEEVFGLMKYFKKQLFSNISNNL